jgi:hypothetical protein
MGRLQRLWSLGVQKSEKNCKLGEAVTKVAVVSVLPAYAWHAINLNGEGAFDVLLPVRTNLKR